MDYDPLRNSMMYSMIFNDVEPSKACRQRTIGPLIQEPNRSLISSTHYY